MLSIFSFFPYQALSSDAIYFEKGNFLVLFTNKTFSIHEIKKNWDKKLRIRVPLDRKFISQNVPVIPDNLMEPITSCLLYTSDAADE